MRTFISFCLLLPDELTEEVAVKLITRPGLMLSFNLTEQRWSSQVREGQHWVVAYIDF